MPEYTQDELDYVEGHAASCICVKCEDQRKQTDNAVAAMRDVTADPPEGAVLELVEAATRVLAVSIDSADFLYAMNALDATLSRFRVEGEGV